MSADREFGSSDSHVDQRLNEEMAEVSLDDEVEVPEQIEEEHENQVHHPHTVDLSTEETVPAPEVNGHDIPIRITEETGKPEDQEGISGVSITTTHPENVLPSATESASGESRPASRPGSSAFGAHMRTPSSRTSISLSRSNTQGGPQLSAALIIPGLETIAESKEAKRNPALLQAAQKALDLCKGNDAYSQPRAIVDPLRLACETQSEKLIIASLDLVAKLVSHSFFHEDYPPEGQPSLADVIAHIVTMSYTESSSPAVGLQVVKALLSLVLSPTLLIHQSSLLKAVRTVYNVYLLSSDTTNQMIAQGGLTQMVHHIFARIDRDAVRTRPGTPRTPNTQNGRTRTPISADSKSTQEQSGDDRASASDNAPVQQQQSEAGNESGKPVLSVTSFAEPNPNDGIHLDNKGVESLEKLPAHPLPIATAAATDENLVGPQPLYSAHPDDQEGSIRHLTTAQLFVKDAFLVFRALCKLNMEPLLSESEKDPRAHDLRSKLLSLHLVLSVLRSHSDLFADASITIPSASSNGDTPFLQATKQYICLSLSRNALSSVPQVFELSIEIFFTMLQSLRAQLKKEIEVLFNEIFIPILEMRHASLRQKSTTLAVYLKLCQDPQMLVDIYINYDCDRASLENIYERLVNVIAKTGQMAPGTYGKADDLTENGKNHTQPILAGFSTGTSSDYSRILNKYTGMSGEARLKRQSLECVVATLKSLVAWVQANKMADRDEVFSMNGEPAQTPRRSEHRMSIASSANASTPDVTLPEDDPEKLETARQRKVSLLEGIRLFNFKPKKGIQYLIDHKFIRSSKPDDIARFLLRTEGLNKAMIGEYLGDGEETNVAVMHAFVDMLDFTNLPFTEAVRLYLQSFRLPGEAQKIDRFMLKFAERYIANNPSTVFANADTAYILAFSVIMLNTDAHNKNLKTKRMSKVEFVKNNRGINDGQDLPDDFLGEIYDEIQKSEIKMKDEVELAPVPNTAGLAGTLANVGRDLHKEAYVLQSEAVANKAEALFKTLVRQQRRTGKNTDHFFSASHLEHVRPMFEVAWMPCLAAISAPMQETENMSAIILCLDGFKNAIKIAGMFDLELERDAYLSTVAKFTYLNNLAEMRPKNVEAIKTLLDIAISDGNNLKASWREVLTCVSQLERMQLISAGIDVPELHRRESATAKKRPGRKLADEVADESRSTQVTVAADMVFSSSKNLSGSAIVDFVRALSEVSWEEIQSSASSPQPRLFSLQKLVDIAYYNMGRIRLEWSNIWQIVGVHFNQVCCHNNPNVSFFALDALRQLAMRFLEKDELAHFKFQKDFLKPFEYAMTHNVNADAREMILQCLQQMLQARVNNLRSGWSTMFKVFSAASRVLTARVPNYAFDLVTTIYREHFDLVLKYGSFSDFCVCLTDFSKVTKFQKISLQAIGMLQSTVPKLLESPESTTKAFGEEQTDGKLAPGTDERMARYWFPVLFAFYDIIMTGEDLEVRRMALDSLFETLTIHGSGFSLEFWNSICQEVLFPIFSVLQTKKDVSRFSTQEDLSVWLSTTMISALRNLIALYTHYFEILQEYLDGLLDLLCACICQENDTLARIGTSCFQQLLENNVKKLSPQKWERIVTAFVQLFKTTTAYQLFDETLRSDRELAPGDPSADEGSSNLVAPALLTPMDPEAQTNSTPRILTLADRRRIFKQIIVKCVLQLLLIETTHELLQNEEVYNTIPAKHLLRFMSVLDDSYQFARKFNADKDLRMALWKVGFMKQLPNLLKQESSSASTLVNVLLRMYNDPRPEHIATRQEILKQLVPLGTHIMKDFNAIDPETQPRNVIAWTPVVVEILQGCCSFEDESFTDYLPELYPLVTDMLTREMAMELWQAVREFYVKTGQVKGLMPKGDA
ncbi:hypothetical protein QFC24_000140 [Naganishia onofrii]|uniref:Uncharacterized protein n=1 Tax=Naganishia onofrii TaxID=1851511 RepID=A0ACC2XXI7_9TREE|nr:hypothetical protein QFC24_000140 [Naganishia onofrii]